MSGTMIIIRQFEEKDLAEVTRFVQQKGLKTSEAYLREHVLQNPFFPETATCNPSVVVFDAAKCVAFQGMVFRKLFSKQAEIWGCEGTVLAMAKEYAYVVGDFFERIMSPKGHSIYYGNTCMPKTVGLLKIAGMKNPGPQSCEKIRFMVFLWGTFFGKVLDKYGVRLPRIVEATGNLFGRLANVLFYRRGQSKTVSEKVLRIHDEPFQQFWNEYLAGNEGVVTSREPAVLNWLFGKGLQSGRFVMFARKIGQRIAGYVILKQQVADAGMRWMVADWIALNNDPDVLRDLLLDARRFVASTGAFCLEMTGFPMKAQSIIKACLPFSRKAVCNTFLFKLFDASLKDALLNTPDKGWFWGPMDGDRCVN